MRGLSLDAGGSIGCWAFSWCFPIWLGRLFSHSQLRPLAPDGKMHVVTIAALDDDEPNRRILITVRNDATGQTGTANAAPYDDC